MDMSKSTGYRAVEELLKAQSTHTSLRRQFEEARVSEMTLAQREVRGESLKYYTLKENLKLAIASSKKQIYCETSQYVLPPRDYSFLHTFALVFLQMLYFQTSHRRLQQRR